MAGYIQNRREVPSGKQGALFIRGQDDGLILSNELAHELKNMYTADEGTLQSVWGPTPFVPMSKRLVPTLEPGELATGRLDRPIEEGERPPSCGKFLGDVGSLPTAYPPELVDSDPDYPIYGRQQHGIHHAVLQNGERDILILHTGGELWEFRGWYQNWRRLISVPASSHGVSGVLQDDDAARFPTQFETVGNGVVIVPQEGRAYFYDGDIIAPLGFTETPAAPTPMAPDDSTSVNYPTANLRKVNPTGVNDAAYAHSGLWPCKHKVNMTGMEYGFGYCRVGTVNPYLTGVDSSPFQDGLMNAGEWRCRTQYIDVFGNLSAPSDPSAPATVSRQGTFVHLSDQAGFLGGNAEEISMPPEAVRVQIAWSGVPTGPDHCVARNLYRTKDLINSGDGKYYALPQNASSTFSALATLNDNICTFYPDNMGDGYLGGGLLDIVPIPKFRLCRSAFGRLFIANMVNNESKIMYSEPGAWGTFQRFNRIVPDASGGEITGLWRSPDGLLAFTSTSTFLIRATDRDGKFSASPLSQEVGCDSPNSIQTLADGSIIWLSRAGFYTYTGGKIQQASPTLDRLFKRLTTSRFKQACSAFDPTTKEYRCWVSSDGSKENNLCLLMKGGLWRTRTDVSPRDVCVTDDSRGYMLAAGIVTDDALSRSGVYLLDHATTPQDDDLRVLVDEREAMVETAWLQGLQSKRKETVPYVFLWFRETCNESLTVEVMRDWREDVVETIPVARYSTVDRPPVWGTAVLGDPSAKFRRRRPYWSRIQVYLPSSESFKLRIKGTGPWEFIGLSFDLSPRTYGNAQLPG